MMPKWTKEQLKAIKEKGKNIIVSAGAGSGKTAVLTERVLEKLKDGIKINELLILTFTNAAAGEMKERIRDKISKESSLQDNLSLLESAYITTFDSYTLSLVKKYNDILNVSSNIQIIEGSIISILKEEFMEEVFQELYEENNSRFQNFLDVFTIKNDQNIKSSLLKIYEKLTLILDLDNFLDTYIDTYLNKDKINNYILEYTNILKSKIAEIEPNLLFIENIEPDYASILGETLQRLLASTSYNEIKESLNITIPRRPNNSEEIKEYKDNIDNILKDLKKELRFQDEDEIRESLILTKEYLEVMIDIFKRFNLKLNNYKKSQDLYEFNDISLMAIKLLKDNQMIREEVKNSFKEICIDEYQDTNDLQEEFISLIQNNNVYMVGDIKQSIYGFRNANPQIFKEKYDEYKEGIKGIKIDLLDNFRSREEVVMAINEIFSLIMDSTIGGADYKKEHLMRFGNKVYTENKEEDNNLTILNYPKSTEYKNNEIEAFIIGRDILNKINNHFKVVDKKTNTLRDACYDDFCIIMDRGTDFSLYKKIFEYLNIPLSIYEDKVLTKEVDVKLINNLIGLIIKIREDNFDTDFKYYFMSVGRSYLFSYSDTYLFEIMKNENFKETTLYKKADEVSLKISSLTSYDVLKLIINDFHFYENMIKVGEVKERIIRLDNLLNMAKNLSNMGYTLKMFQEFISKTIKSKNEIKYPEPKEDGCSVKIMNIHKSKGLEFSLCYFSGFYKEFNLEEIKDKFTFDKSYGFIVPFFKEGVDDTILFSLLKNKYLLESISEKIRLLYVALTRAKEKIMIVCPLEVKEKVSGIVDDAVRRKYNSFLSIMNSIAKMLDDYIVNVDLAKLNLSKKYLFEKEIALKIPQDKRKITYEEIMIPNKIISKERASKKEVGLRESQDLKKLSYGRSIHKVLEMTDFLKIDKNNSYYDMINSLVRKLNITNDTKIYKEYEFMYREKDVNYQGIIDLLLEYPEEIKIVDYKLKNITDESYLEQLQIYYNYVRLISPKKITVYLYSIINKELEEITLKEKVGE